MQQGPDADDGGGGEQSGRGIFGIEPVRPARTIRPIERGERELAPRPPGNLAHKRQGATASPE